MPDIEMCQNKTCPIRQTCYRHEATPSLRQSYGEYTPVVREGRGAGTVHCGGFIEMAGRQTSEPTPPAP